MRSFIISLAIAAGLADALPKRQAATVFEDSYEALVTGRCVGLLHGLEYIGADVAVARPVNGTKPIVPHSKPKYAESTKSLAQVQNNGVTFDSYVHIHAAQNLSSFDLYNFYFACTEIDGPAQPCTIAVSGGGDTLTFAYAPESTSEAPFARTQINYPRFRQIQDVSIGIVTGSAPAGNTALAIDSLEHINYAS